MVEEEHTVMPVAPSVPEEQDNQESTIIVTKEVNTVPPTAPKNNNTLIIILVCAIVAILGIFAALYFATDIFKSDDKHEDEDEMEMLDDDEWSEEDEEEEVVIASPEEEEAEDYEYDEYEDTEVEAYEGELPPEAYFTFTGNVGSFGRYQLNVMGDEGVISPNDPDKHGYLSNIYYDSETGYLSMDASNTSGVNVGTYEGTVMHEDDHYVYEGNFTNTSGRSTSFRMIGN